jgi:teichuronic acid biosynthesis glycosyltransferase TuaC
VHVIAPARAKSTETNRDGRGQLTIWRLWGGSLFGSPGALARAKQCPSRLFQLLHFLPAVRARLAELGRIDRVIAHFLIPCGYPLSIGTCPDVEVVLHGSDVRVVLAMPAPLRRLLIETLLSRDTRFRFVAEDLRAKLAASISRSQSARMELRSRVELPMISIAPTKSGAARQEPTDGAAAEWVVCGRLIPSKRVDLAIREAARHRARLTVIGDGPLRAELEALAARFEPRARFTGALRRGDALAHIADAHKLVHFSEAEGAPTVIREARALGVPVLATPVGDVARWAIEDPGIEIFRPLRG